MSRQWVLSFPFQVRFLFASRPEIMSRVLIQRFGSALNLNIHFHMLFLDGVYLIDREPPVFRRLPAPRPQALEVLIQTISQRIGACLEREGLPVRDIENSYRDGTTHIILEPLDFIARLAALVPKPRVNLTRFHGVFAPNSALRHHVTPSGRGKRKPSETKTPAQRRAAMTWAQRLKRAFKIDIETCEHCGGTVKVIACTEDSAVVKRILDHLEQRPVSNAVRTHPARAPPLAAQRDGS